MLQTLRLTDWKSFRAGARTAVPFSSTTFLVGPNASGKSNVLDALRLLQGCAKNLPLDEVLRGHWEGGRQTWSGVRGGAAEAAWAGSSEFSLQTVLQHEAASLKYMIRVATLPEVRVVEERLSHGGRALFDTHADSLGQWKGGLAGGAINVGFASSGRGKWSSVAVPSSHSVLGQLEPAERMKPDVMEIAKGARTILRDMVLLELQPNLMRGPAPQHAAQMGASGENVAAVLHQMDVATRQDLLDWLTELCVPRLTGIDFELVDAVREVYFLLEERGSTRISSRSLSDGTLRFLGILVALLTTEEGVTILLEEPDVGLHPARIHLLADILEQIPKRRRIQVIATTHSPSLLAHLSAEALEDVVAFDRDPDTGGSIAARVGDLPNFTKLRDSGERDHLIATGWLERAL